MTDEELALYYSQHIPVDRDLLEPLGLVLWAAARLHSSIRDTLGLDLGDGLSDKPFDDTLGSVITQLKKRAYSKGTPWSTEIEGWADKYAVPARTMRDQVIHGVPHTARDGRQALSTPRRHGGPRRLTKDDLQITAGYLVLASVRLDEVRKRCKEKP